MGSKSFILTFVAAVRARMVRMALLEGALLVALCLSVLGAVVVLLAAQRVDPVVLRWLLGLGAAGVVIGFGWDLGARTIRRARHVRRVALFVESRVPDLHSGVVSTIEFADHPAHTGFSTELLEGLADHTADRLRRVELSSLVSSSRAHKAGQLLAIVTGAIALAITAQPGPFQDGLAWLLEGRSEAATVTGPESQVLDANVIDIRFRYVYPAYTRLPAREITGGGGDITGPPGTVVHIRATALRDTREAMLLVGEGAPRVVPLEAADSRDLSGTVTVEETTTYRFRLVTPAGAVVDEETAHAIDVEPDHDPEIRLLSPDKDAEVNIQDQVQLIYQAQDDFGLGQVDVVYRRRGAEPVRRRAHTLDADLRYQGELQLDVAQTEAKPGEVLEIWVEAFDQDTVNGPKVGKSEVRHIKIWSPEEKHEENVDQLAAVVEAMLRVLADRLESPIEHLKLEEWEPSLAIASKSSSNTEKIVHVLDGIVASISEDPMMPEPVLADVTTVRDRHDELRRAEAKVLKEAVLLEEWHPRRREQLTLLWTHNNESVDALEDDIMKLEDLIDRLREEKLLTQTRDLLSQQGELLQLLEKLKEGSDPQDMKKAQAQIDALQAKLQAMMEQVAKQAKKMPFDNVNMSALDPEGTHENVLDFQKELDEIRELLAQGKIDEAMAKAEALQKKMAELMSTMEQGFEGMSLAGGGAERQEKLGKIEQQLGELSRDEKGIHQETGEINDARREALEAQHESELKDVLEEQRRRVEALRKQLSQVNPKGMDQRDQEALDGSKEMLRNLEEVLAQEELDGALRLSDEAQKALSELTQELRTGADLAEDAERAQMLHRAGRKVGMSAAEAKDIAQTLRDLVPEPGQMLSPEDRQRLQELAEKQGGVGGKLSKLRQEMKQMGGEVPGLDGLDEQLDGAEKSMKQAEQRLRDSHPQKAEMDEEAAMERLDRARKRVQQMMKPQRSQQMGMGMSHDRAEIPKPEDYKVPAEFRDEVMRAMRENAPSKYRELVERYYQELIK